jgi:hypothetical protein
MVAKSVHWYNSISRQLLATSLSLILASCIQSSVMPSDPQERQLWLETEAKGFQSTVAQGLNDASAGGSVFEQGETKIDKNKLVVTFIYQIEKQKWVDYALSQHANYTDLLILLNFQIRKNLCRKVFDSSLHANNVKVDIMTRVVDEYDYLIVFKEENCMLYL